MLPIALFRNVVHRAAAPAVFFVVERLCDLFGRPHEELAFLTFRIGIGGGIERSLVIRHFTKHIIEYFRDHLAVGVIPGNLERLEIGSPSKALS